MKKFLFLSILILAISCQNTTTTNNIGVGKAIDTNTGLCFAAINSMSYDGGEITSITCVPCDSLKNVNVTIVNQK